MHLMTIIALAAATLMSPPMQIEWATAEVQIGGENLNAEQRCGLENARVLDTGVHFVDGLASQGGMLNLYGPTEDIIEDFFGEDGLPMPDPDLSWKALLKQIR